MPAHEHLSDIQFRYSPIDVGERTAVHRVQAFAGPTNTHVGDLLWNAKGIRNVIVSPDQQRRGVATAMWHEGHRLAAENAKIPTPKHSPDRTQAGDAWARSVGGRLPRRKK
jgi:hypothetical protein